MKGEIIRRRLEPISVIENIPLPLEIYEQRRNTMVSADYVYAHGLNHLHSTSKDYGFKKIKYVPEKRQGKRTTRRV